eukprot:TRINITY_DN1318_c0_g1_i1.p1 TRINITY_DN1318_c0_g1~~TRINITY_DN1318_c0_g1_i1.p1  ORF type:complete len:103 (-),score=11.59 TRINITY_DN1318_c0_g1_i1:28-336(-)
MQKNIIGTNPSTFTHHQLQQEKTIARYQIQETAFLCDLIFSLNLSLFAVHSFSEDTNIYNFDCCLSRWMYECSADDDSISTFKSDIFLFSLFSFFVIAVLCQ